MNKGRVGEERRGKETDGCPLTVSSVQLMAYGSDVLSSHLTLPPSISILLIAILAPLDGAW
jgi:hypothetical protein